MKCLPECGGDFILPAGEGHRDFFPEINKVKN